MGSGVQNNGKLIHLRTADFLFLAESIMRNCVCTSYRGIEKQQNQRKINPKTRIQKLWKIEAKMTPKINPWGDNVAGPYTA